MKHLDLFSGIGGFSLAAQMIGGFKTTQFVEINKAVHPTLNAQFPGVPIHDDVTTFYAKPGQFDIITAGFPCQDLSVAGSQKGLDGDRSGLFYEIIRIIRECRPRYVLLENVPALLTSNGGRDMATVLWELSQVGLDAEWQTVSAQYVGSNHRRERLWIIAYPNGLGRSEPIVQEYSPIQNRWILPTNDKREKLRPTFTGFSQPWPGRSSTLTDVPRMDDGIPKRVDK